jgi:Golgi phosphoprotein 3
MPLTMPEELLLLMLDDASGRLLDRAMPAGDYALAAAVLSELALAGRLDSDPQRLYVTNPAPTGDPLQDSVLARLGGMLEQQHTQGWIETLAMDAAEMRAALFARLVAAGVLRQEDSRFLWMFAERRYPQVSGREEREVKARLLGVLFHDDIPDTRDVLLIGLARAANLFTVILSEEELARAQPRIDLVADFEEINRALAAAVRNILGQVARYSFLT